MARDFTLFAYELILQTLQEQGYETSTVLQAIERRPADRRVAVLRHDVDRKPLNALAMAELENAMGIRSTYYFRIKPCSFVPPIVSRIAKLGHEVGYHYEDFHTAKYDANLAIELFNKNLAALRKLAPVSTISMHGSPLSKYNNMKLWETKSFQKLNVFDCTLSNDWSSYFYFTDTGRCFNGSSTNLRDYIVANTEPLVGTTKQLVEFIKSSGKPHLKISIHPERWDDNIVNWSLQLTKDYTINSIKRVLQVARPRH
ncbi:MAG: hypothetical protein VW058_01630 [Flavobacteriaceae bacterium]